MRDRIQLFMMATLLASGACLYGWFAYQALSWEAVRFMVLVWLMLLTAPISAVLYWIAFTDGD